MTAARVEIPSDRDDVTLSIGNRDVALTNLRKLFWPDEGITKRDLIQYYADVAAYLLPHIKDRAMVMKRYPNGATKDFFFMKRAPEPRPSWIRVCTIPHKSGNIIDFPMIQDLPALLWVINLGCIDLNPWYGRCADYDCPDFLHFDLDPGPGADFEMVCEVALLLRELLDEAGLPTYPKTTGSKGLHIYIPIKRDPVQKEVWSVAKTIAFEMQRRHPSIVTAEYRIAKRPRGRVLVDYNQNAWGRTLASVYSVRPRPRAPVSMPVTWKDIEKGLSIDDYRLDNVPAVLRRSGDRWAAMLGKDRIDLRRLLHLKEMA
ncbi:MAG TPA: non-homologous end-joining DNA ligase [Nitrospirales bacterium]|nr:non-homologous end-joining DNA ligase [Nitrospirales bacterium]